ncbi:hypothetical protein KFE25_007310 [Diacronema lutheri]|uniref:Uncharacterized protein n=1 Tax=Diacronema lutheri TaxID=2081491 RepID=A0A8J5XUL1_DIALT|nr:hypothetical protein KFE25_007310 [Diacronema lutheri]
MAAVVVALFLQHDHLLLPRTVLLPRDGCARGDGVSTELCAPPLAAHPLTAVAVSPLLDRALCERFVAAAEAAAARAGGWRSVLRYETREVPLAEIPELQRWYDAHGASRLAALLRSHHVPRGPAGSPPLALALFDSNVVKYDARDAEGSRGVTMHTDGEDVFTFNVLLSPRAAFGAGAHPAGAGTRAPPDGGGDCDGEGPGRRGVGAYFAHLNRTACVAQGEVLTYYGGLAHSSGEPLGWGVRYVWQGFYRPMPPAARRVAGADGGAGARLAALDAELLAVSAPLARAAVTAVERAPDFDRTALARLLANLCAVQGRQQEQLHVKEAEASEEEAKGALDACKRAIAAEPTAGAYNNLALVLARTGDALAAEAALRAGLALLAQRAAWCGARRGASDGGEDGAARPPADAQHSCARDAPEGAELWSNLGALLREQRGRGADAAAACDAAVALAPDVSALHANRGAAYAELDPIEARRAYERALELDPRAANARFSMAVLLLRAGDADGAARALREVLRDEPRDDEARRALARALVELGRLDEAIALGREGARLSAPGADVRPAGAAG